MPRVEFSSAGYWNVFSLNLWQNIRNFLNLLVVTLSVMLDTWQITVFRTEQHSRAQQSKQNFHAVRNSAGKGSLDIPFRFKCRDSCGEITQDSLLFMNTNKREALNKKFSTWRHDFTRRRWWAGWCRRVLAAEARTTHCNGPARQRTIPIPFGSPLVVSRDRLAMEWTIRASNPGGDSIFPARPDRPWGTPSVLYAFSGVKRPESGVDHPPPSNTEVKERVIYTSTPPLGLHVLF
jgi:hypothetical protein